MPKSTHVEIQMPLKMNASQKKLKWE